MDKIVGMMWNKNEGDILPFTISKALEVVDYLVMADDGSTDNSMDVMQSFKDHPKVLHIENAKPGTEKKKTLLDALHSRFNSLHTSI